MTPSAQKQPSSLAFSGPSTLYWLVMALIILFIARLAALAYAQTDLFFDEAQYWAWAKQPAFGYFSKPPLLAWIIGLVTAACGDGPACARLSAPLLHSFTSLVIYFVALQVFKSQDQKYKIAFWSALAFATLPAVSLSSTLISTDVPLLLCWSLALLCWFKLYEPMKQFHEDPQNGEAFIQSFYWAIGLGLALGFGFLAKYAMGFFYICLIILFLLVPAARFALRCIQLHIALILPGAFLILNIVWNSLNGSVTLKHTADNANWKGTLFHPEKALEFFGAQFGVMGPILFAGLLILIWRAWRGKLPNAQIKTLLAFSVPVLVLITIQALLSRAHANWAAVTYPAATIAVIAAIFHDKTFAWLKASFALHSLALAALLITPAFAPDLKLPNGKNPYQRVLGWQDLADKTRAQLYAAPYRALVTDDRALSASLIYYLRDDLRPNTIPPFNFRSDTPDQENYPPITLTGKTSSNIPHFAWRRGPVPHDHFELTRPFPTYNPDLQTGPVLLVTFKQDLGPIEKFFSKVTVIAKNQIKSGANKGKTLRFIRLEQSSSQ